jgi:type I restriction enzyme, S subunit
MATGAVRGMVASDLVLRLRLGDRIAGQYLAYALASLQLRGWWLTRSSGASSTMKKITRSQLAAVLIGLPPLEAQHDRARQVESGLVAVQHFVAVARERQVLVDCLRDTVLNRAFGPETPLSTMGVLATPQPGWQWTQLATVARLESGHTPSRSRPDWRGGDVPWVQLADIRAVDGQVIHSTSETTNAEGIAHSAARILPADSIVMSRTASVGFVARLGRPMSTSQDFVNWVCGPDLDPEFLMHLLIRSRDYIRSLSAGAIHKTVYYPTVKDFHVCIPPFAEQRRIAAELRERLATIDQMTHAIDTQLEAIEALPAALLRRAFEEIEAA